MENLVEAIAKIIQPEAFSGYVAEGEGAELQNHLQRELVDAARAKAREILSLIDRTVLS